MASTIRLNPIHRWSFPAEVCPFGSSLFLRDLLYIDAMPSLALQQNRSLTIFLH